MTIVKRVLVAGELNVDLLLVGYHTFPTPGQEVLVDGFQMALGSASAICAAGLARLGTAVRFAGVIGRDLWGDYCLESLRERGVDVSAVQRHSTVHTGVTVSISSAADRALVTYLGAITALHAADISDDLLRSAQHLHVSSYYLQQGLRSECAELFSRATALGLTTSLDPGFDPAERWDSDIREVLRSVDVFLPNESELAGITRCTDTADSLRVLQNGRTLTVAKLGAHGAVALMEGRLVAQPPFSVQPVDTTGAGDSFNAGFLHAWLQGQSLQRALMLAAACGAVSTLSVGGATGQATLEEAEALMKQQSVHVTSGS
jgi:sugar/nucleoside kinase (ribokinase family)